MTIKLCQWCGEEFDKEKVAIHMCNPWPAFEKSNQSDTMLHKLNQIISLLKEIEFQLRTKL